MDLKLDKMEDKKDKVKIVTMTQTKPRKYLNKKNSIKLHKKEKQATNFFFQKSKFGKHRLTTSKK